MTISSVIPDASPACDPSQAVCGCDVAHPCLEEGRTCVGGLCIVGCNFSYECSGGGVCFDGACVSSCSATVPCAAGYKCVLGGCVLDSANPQCGTTTACSNGEICVNGLCTSACTANSQCALGEVCDGTSGSCVVDQSIKPLCGPGIALQCPHNEVCLADGFCHYPCTSASSCKLIQKLYDVCANGYCAQLIQANPECTLELPCPVGQNCVSNQCQ